MRHLRLLVVLLLVDSISASLPMPDLATPVSAAGIANDVSCIITANGSSPTCTLTGHAAKVLVMITVAIKSVIVIASSVTVGGDAATNDAVINDGTVVTAQLFHIFRSSAGTETVSVTLSGTASFAVTADCFTGTATSPEIEAISTYNRGGSGETAPISSGIAVLSGSSGRRVYMGVAVAGGTNTISTVTPGVGQTEISKAALSYGGITAESNYEDTYREVTMLATLGVSGDGTLHWVTVGAVILPATELATPQNDFWNQFVSIVIDKLLLPIIVAVIAGVILYYLLRKKQPTSIQIVEKAGKVVQNVFVIRGRSPESIKQIMEEIPDQIFAGGRQASGKPVQAQDGQEVQGLIEKVKENVLGNNSLAPLVADALEIARTLKKGEESRWLERELYGYEKKPTDQPNTFPEYRRVTAKVAVRLTGITTSGESLQ